MSLPAILPTMFGTALGPPFGGVGAKLTILTGSGNWRPHPKAGRVLIMATGPGATGVANQYSGGAGGTAIKMIDLTQLSGQDIAYVVGAGSSGVATQIAGLIGYPGSGILGGAASGGDMNLTGGRGHYCPVLDVATATAVSTSVSTTVSVTGLGVTLNIDRYLTGGGSPGSSTNTVQSASGSSTASSSATSTNTLTKGNAPGGASFWGGCDAFSANATLYGVGGPAEAAAAYAGAPGVIYILGDLSDG